MNGNGKVFIALAVTLAASMPALLMAIENTMVRAALTLLAVVVIYVLGVYTPSPKSVPPPKLPSAPPIPIPPERPRVVREIAPPPNPRNGRREP